MEIWAERWPAADFKQGLGGNEYRVKERPLRKAGLEDGRDPKPRSVGSSGS